MELKIAFVFVKPFKTYNVYDTVHAVNVFVRTVESKPCESHLEILTGPKLWT